MIKSTWLILGVVLISLISVLVFASFNNELEGQCIIRSVSGNQNSGITVNCKSGEVVTGGGWRDDSSGLGPETDQDASRPLADGSGWYCEDDESGDNAECYAVCCDKDLIKTKIEEENKPEGSGVNVYCDEGFAFGGGFLDLGGNNDDYDSNAPLFSVDGWRCAEDNSGLGSKCYAVCGEGKEDYELECYRKSVTANQNSGVSVQCDEGYVMTGGGFTANEGAGGNDDDQDFNMPIENGWYCREDASGSSSECFAVCCKLSFVGCVPETEICNYIDDDCDEEVDEGFNAGEFCSVGLGECYSEGEYVCTVDGSGTECDAVAGEPSQEICDDGLDNDCDGYADCDDSDCNEDDACKSKCYVDEDCGSQPFECLGNFCEEDGNVWQLIRKYYCVEGSCVSEDDKILIEVCDENEECESGMCVPLPPECTEDDDCNDGLWCNGEESCVGGECVSGIAIDCSPFDISEIATCDNNQDNNPFTWDYRPAFVSVCDEDADQCTIGNDTIGNDLVIGKCGVECLSDDDCDEDEECEEYECIKEDEEVDRHVTNLRRIVDFCGDDYCDVEIGEDELTCPQDCKIQILSYDLDEPGEDAVELKSKLVGEDYGILIWLFLLLILLLILLIVIIYLLKR